VPRGMKQPSNGDKNKNKKENEKKKRGKKEKGVGFLRRARTGPKIEWPTAGTGKNWVGW